MKRSNQLLLCEAPKCDPRGSTLRFASHPRTRWRAVILALVVAGDDEEEDVEAEEGEEKAP